MYHLHFNTEEVVALGVRSATVVGRRPSSHASSVAMVSTYSIIASSMSWPWLQCTLSLRFWRLIFTIMVTLTCFMNWLLVCRKYLYLKYVLPARPISMSFLPNKNERQGKGDGKNLPV